MSLESSLEDAQLEKLARSCRTLGLQAGQQFLDVGCGWGGLLAYAGEHCGVNGFGCTLSDRQREFADALFRSKGLAGRLTVRKLDYRDLAERFDRIASIGMFEQVGRSRLGAYFKKIYSLLADDGVFLNRGIVRPIGMSDGPETLFLQKNVFPGGELEHLPNVIRAAEHAGFEVRKMEDYRHQYALTCQAWVARLQENEEMCRRLVGDSAYRTWLLYLAASAVNFEDGCIDAVEIVFVKR